MIEALQLRDIELTYPTRRGTIQALSNVNLSVREGEFVAILGPSGCGKSTLLKLAAGLLPASGGEITLGGHPLSGPGKQTGVVFQKPNLLPWKTVLENVLLPARTLGLDIAPARL